MARCIAPMLKEEVRHFLETTTIRGVQRIVKSKSKALFAFWLLAVLTSAALLLWQLSAVFIRYSEYPVNTLYVQSPESQSRTFPVITVCNLCPFKLVHANHMSMKYSDYVTMLIKTFDVGQFIIKFSSYNNFEELRSYVDLNNYIYKDLLSPSGYFKNFPIPSDIEF